jgi:hypothetical protein
MFRYIAIVALSLLRAPWVESAAFIVPSATNIQTTTIRLGTTQSSEASVTSSSKSLALPPLTSLPPMSRVTPPPSLHQLDLRQRCWNDQGFSVNCAVWTGYRYSWGPSSNPYDYWSGGGSGSGGGNVVSGGGRTMQPAQSLLKSIFVLWIVVALSGIFAAIVALLD